MCGKVETILKCVTKFVQIVTVTKLKTFSRKFKFQMKLQCKFWRAFLFLCVSMFVFLLLDCVSDFNIFRQDFSFALFMEKSLKQTVQWFLILILWIVLTLLLWSKYNVDMNYEMCYEVFVVNESIFLKWIQHVFTSVCVSNILFWKPLVQKMFPCFSVATNVNIFEFCI